MVIDVYICDLCDNKFAVDGLSTNKAHVVCCPYDGNDGVDYLGEIQTKEFTFEDTEEDD